MIGMPRNGEVVGKLSGVVPKRLGKVRGGRADGAVVPIKLLFGLRKLFAIRPERNCGGVTTFTFVLISS